MSFGDKPKVGQKLWFVPVGLRGSHPHEVTVSKVGRVWFSVAGQRSRFSVETGWGEPTGFGYGTVGSCWPSREAWEKEQELHRAWRAFVEEVERRPLPKGLTLEMLKVAREALGLEP